MLITLIEVRAIEGFVSQPTRLPLAASTMLVSRPVSGW
jgi:hypothetical protein